MTFARAGFAAALVAALLLVAPPLRAAAGTTGTHCAVGDITRYGTEVDGDGETQVSIAGWVRPCAPPVAPTGFEIIFYYPGAAYLRWDGTPRTYASPTEPTPFAAATAPDLQHRTSLDGLQAICLTDRGQARVACVGIVVKDGETPPVVTPIPTYDPRVRFVGMPPEDIQTCGSCV